MLQGVVKHMEMNVNIIVLMQVILGAHMDNYPIQMRDTDLHYLWTPNAS